MSILQQERNLIQAMQKQNFEPFFDGDKEDAYDTIANAMSSFVDYQNHVINMSIVQPIIYQRYEGAEIRDKVMELDSTRKIKHDAAIANANMLNRICEGYGIAPMVNVDTKDRYAVADFIGQFCSEIYEENKSGAHLTREQQGKLVDEHVNKRQLYDENKLHNRLVDLDAKYGNLIKSETGEEYQP